MLFTSWLRELRSTAFVSPRLFGRRNLKHHRQWQKRRSTRGQALATAGLEKLEERILLAAPAFGQDTYEVSGVGEDASFAQAICSMSANDPDWQAMTFAIIGGNEHNRFSIQWTNHPFGNASAVELPRVRTSGWGSARNRSPLRESAGSTPAAV
jgi:hypothetical protein